METQNLTRVTNSPVVTVCCVAFNHERYIEECLNSILSQKTNFEFEILIHDDASSDSTPLIIKNYLKRYPGKIRAILQTTNQFSIGNDKFLSTVVFPQTKGKYIAYCDGDDFWTDDNKLQKQFDFLEANPDFSMCFHDAKIIKDNICIENYLKSYEKIIENNDTFSFNHILKDNFIPTSSSFCRSSALIESAKWINDLPFQDWTLWILNSRIGKIKKLPNLMGVYRIHHSSTWSSKSNISRQKSKLRFYNQLSDYLEQQETKAILNAVIFLADQYIEYNDKLYEAKIYLEGELKKQETLINIQEAQFKVLNKALGTQPGTMKFLAFFSRLLVTIIIKFSGMMKLLKKIYRITMMRSK